MVGRTRSASHSGSSSSASSRWSGTGRGSAPESRIRRSCTAGRPPSAASCRTPSSSRSCSRSHGARRRCSRLRRPVSLRRAALFIGCAIVAIYLFESVYTLIVDPGNEQGLTPSHWEPAHAAAYITNGVVICTWVPLVEELTYRGLGYSLLERFGRWPAILAVGLAFGLAHGLVLSLPIIVAFGCVLAWVARRPGQRLSRHGVTRTLQRDRARRRRHHQHLDAAGIYGVRVLTDDVVTRAA